MTRQLLMKRISSKPANGDVDPDLTHQLTVGNYAGRRRERGPMLAGRRSWVPGSPPAARASAGTTVLGRAQAASSAGGQERGVQEPSTRITVEDKVARFDDLVAGKAGVVRRLAGGFAVVELSETPAARGGVFARVLDHELH